MSSGQRGLSDDSIMELQSYGQVENGTPSTSPPYWETDDDEDDSGSEYTKGNYKQACLIVYRVLQIGAEFFSRSGHPPTRAPDRVPGGSSSGSAVAVAVAVNLVDFSLGTDTGGSVRVPAAYCGIFGFRPSHGSVSESGVIPMAQSFDIVGWLARDPSTLTLVGCLLLPSPIEPTKEPTHITIPEDCFQLLGSLSDQLSQILTSSVENMYGRSFIATTLVGQFQLN